MFCNRLKPRRKVNCWISQGSFTSKESGLSSKCIMNSSTTSRTCLRGGCSQTVVKDPSTHLATAIPTPSRSWTKSLLLSSGLSHSRSNSKHSSQSLLRRTGKWSSTRTTTHKMTCLISWRSRTLPKWGRSASSVTTKTARPTVACHTQALWPYRVCLRSLAFKTTSASTVAREEGKTWFWIWSGKKISCQISKVAYPASTEVWGLKMRTSKKKLREPKSPSTTASRSSRSQRYWTKTTNGIVTNAKSTFKQLRSWRSTEHHQSS